MPDGRRSSPAHALAHAPCASDNQSPVLRVGLARIFARKQPVLPIDSCTLAEGTAGKPKPCQISEEKRQSLSGFLPLPPIPEDWTLYAKPARVPSALWQGGQHTMAGADKLAELRPAHRRGFLPGKQPPNPKPQKGHQGAEWRSSGSPSSKDPETCHHQLLSSDWAEEREICRKAGTRCGNSGVRMQVLGKVLVR